jgi:hypothetical protein
MSSALPPDSSVALSLLSSREAWMALPGASLGAVVDEANAVAESNETNNAFRMNLAILETPPDSDSDGLSDPDEIVAGTEVASAQSTVRILAAEGRGTAGLLLRWSSIAGMKYRVASKERLDELVWADASETLEAVGPETTWTTAGNQPGPATFYRVRVIPP